MLNDNGEVSPVVVSSEFRGSDLSSLLCSSFGLRSRRSWLRFIQRKRFSSDASSLLKGSMHFSGSDGQSVGGGDLGLSHIGDRNSELSGINLLSHLISLLHLIVPGEVSEGGVVQSRNQLRVLGLNEDFLLLVGLGQDLLDVILNDHITSGCVPTKVGSHHVHLISTLHLLNKNIFINPN